LHGSGVDSALCIIKLGAAAGKSAELFDSLLAPAAVGFEGQGRKQHRLSTRPRGIVIKLFPFRMGCRNAKTCGGPPVSAADDGVRDDDVGVPCRGHRAILSTNVCNDLGA
jgi:hypothetical protein